MKNTQGGDVILGLISNFCFLSDKDIDSLVH